MNIQVSEYADVMEQQLKAARLDLLEDGRLTAGHGAGGEAALETVAQLIRDKMEAAARYGYEGMESSLRPEAQDRLLASGLDIEFCRHTLDAAAQCLHPGAVPRPIPAAPGPPPNLIAGGVLAGGAVVAIGLYAIFRFPPVVLMLLVAAAIIPAVLVRGAKLTRNAASRDRFLHEYPGELCRHYVQETATRLKDYEQILNEALVRAGAPARAK